MRNLPELKGVRSEGRALMKSPSKSELSYAARAAIRDLFAEDLLQGYVPASITEADIERADLILVMSRDLLAKDVLPKDKTQTSALFAADPDERPPAWRPCPVRLLRTSR